MNEFLGYILANVEHMNDTVHNVQRAVNKLTRSHRYILFGSLAGLGLGLIQERRISELKKSLTDIRKDVNSIQMRIEER